MGTVFKKSFTKPLPDGAEVFTRDGVKAARWRVRGKVRIAPLTAAGDRVLIEAHTYTAKYRDAAGKVVEVATGCRDEQAAKQKLSRWLREVEQVKAGTLDPDALAVARKAAGPLADHLLAYERALVAAEVSDVYRGNVLRAVRRVAADCGITRLADLKRGPVEAWLAERVDEGMSARSRNAYREAVVAFANWCREDGRLSGHDLAKLPKADTKADPRRRRRSLTDDELGRLLEVAARRPLDDARTVRRGKRKGERAATLSAATVAKLEAAGRERALIYKTLVTTGLRCNELRTLTVGQLDLDGDHPRLTLEAANEKNGAGNAVALRSDVAAELRDWIADTGRGPTDPLFTVPAGLRRILDRDLTAAGIPKRDQRGRTIDVHAMRTTFATLLNRAGVAPRVAQAALRHSDIRLTMNTYTDEGLLDTHAAVNRLPGVARRGRPACPTACTGGVQAGSKPCSPGHTRSDERASGGRRRRRT